jgi:hypothetical protein
MSAPREPVPSDEVARNAYAVRTHYMALEMYDMIVPWRWHRWFEAQREVRRRIAALREARGE